MIIQFSKVMPLIDYGFESYAVVIMTKAGWRIVDIFDDSTEAKIYWKSTMLEVTKYV